MVLKLHLYSKHCGSSRWFHGKISRERAEQLLCPKMDGHFLVRESTNFPGDYTLCVCYQGKVEHYRVKYKDHKLTIDDEEFFETLAQLVEVFLFSFSSCFCLCVRYSNII